MTSGTFEGPRRRELGRRPEVRGVEATEMERTFTVITPTILRQTLLDAPRSVEE
jgi:hypothetical protein